MKKMEMFTLIFQSSKDYGALSKYGNEQMLMISTEREMTQKDPNKKNPLGLRSVDKGRIRAELEVTVG